MKKIFIDCYVQENDIVLWLKDSGKNIRVIDRFIPEIFIKGKNLKSLQEKLKNKGIQSYFTKKKSFFNGDEVYVLKIPIYKLSLYPIIIRYIEQMHGYALELYNADLKLEELYMFQKDLFPTAIVDCEIKDKKVISIKSLDSQNEINYTIPHFTITNLKVETEDNLYKTFDTALISIEIDNVKITGTEKEILTQFKKYFEKKDPDIIWTENGNLIIPYIKGKLNKEDIQFNFNRFDYDNFEHKEGESYWTYSNVVYRTSSIYLKGRLHFDTHSFFADNTDFYGLIEGARVCRQRIQKTEMRSAGATVTNLLLYESFKRNFLLPYKVGIYERFKSLGELYEADRGCIIFEPRVGFHTDVAEFDFNSLYPQIMWKYNLSPETLFCKCCITNIVPGLHYNLCTKKSGVVSIVDENLVKRRIELKKQETEIAKEKSSYLKWLLVTMFGYQAFKNRKIGAIEIHESIQAYAREIIIQTIQIAESLGWEVIHGIIDSVYIKKKGFIQEDIKILHEKISKETGFSISHEGNYKWIVFLPSIKNENQPISNHFYGIFKNGNIKCRGIEARRKDTPEIIVNMQLEMIQFLSCVKNEEEFRSLFSQLFNILDKYIKQLQNTTTDQLKISKRIRKTDYLTNIPQNIIVNQLFNEGWELHPGQKIDYIILNEKNKDPFQRYCTADSFKGSFDINKYIKLMIKATINLLLPFNISERDIIEKLKSEKQNTLRQFYSV